MSEVLQLILNLLAENGNTMTYPALYEAVPFEQRSLLKRALKVGKSQGTVREEVVFADGQNTHFVHKL